MTSTFRGTHGTCGDRAELIRKDGFHASVIGRAGPGAYFWAYHEDRAVARTLAIGWYQLAHKKGEYVSCTDKGCGVLYAEVDAEPDECLNCAELAFEEALSKILSRCEIIRDDDINAAYQLLISRLEEAQNKKYRLVHARVKLPTGQPFKQMIALPSPMVHVVRTGLEEIRVTDYEYVVDTA